MHGYSYGEIYLGWIPDRISRTGGRYKIFSGKDEYERVYQKEKEKLLDEMILEARLQRRKKPARTQNMDISGNR